MEGAVTSLPSSYSCSHQHHSNFFAPASLALKSDTQGTALARNPLGTLASKKPRFSGTWSCNAGIICFHYAGKISTRLFRKPFQKEEHIRKLNRHGNDVERLPIQAKYSPQQSGWFQYERALEEGDLGSALEMLDMLDRGSNLQTQDLNNRPDFLLAEGKGELALPRQDSERGVEAGGLLQLEQRETSGLMVAGVEVREKEPPIVRERMLRVLDTCLQSDNLPLVAGAYQLLQARGLLASFGMASDTVGAESSRLITPTLLKERTGLEASNLSPKKFGLSGSSGFATVGLLAATSFLVNSGIDVRPILFVLMGFGLLDATLYGGAGTVQVLSMWPPYRKRVLVHEAGHFVAAYLLGCPVRGVVTDPFQAADLGIQGQAGTQFWDEALDKELKAGRLTGSSIDRYCMVIFAGVAAEAMIYGEAEGGENDENLFKALLGQLQPPWGPSRVSNQARWSVMQSYLLLKKYNKAHAAAVKGLESGATLSKLVDAVEEALAKSPR